MSLNNKNLLIIIASLFIFIACATVVIIFSVNSHLDDKADVTNTHKQLRSLMYNEKYANLKFDDPDHALDIKEQSINLITKKYDLYMFCRLLTKVEVESEYISKNTVENLARMAKEKCIPTYNIIKEKYSDIRAFDGFIETMEYYVPELKK